MKEKNILLLLFFLLAQSILLVVFVLCLPKESLDLDISKNAVDDTKSPLTIDFTAPTTTDNKELFHEWVGYENKIKITDFYDEIVDVLLDVGTGSVNFELYSRSIQISPDKKFAAVTVNDTGRELYLVSNNGNIVPLFENKKDDLDYAVAIGVNEWSPSSTHFIYRIYPHGKLGQMDAAEYSKNELLDLPKGFLHGLYAVNIESGKISWIVDDSGEYKNRMTFAGWLNDDVALLSQGEKVYEYNFTNASLYLSDRFGANDLSNFRLLGKINNEPVWRISNSNFHWLGYSALFVGEFDKIRKIKEGRRADMQSFLFPEDSTKFLFCMYWIDSDDFDTCREKYEYDVITDTLEKIK